MLLDVRDTPHFLISQGIYERKWVGGEKNIYLKHKQKSCRLLRAGQRDAVSLEIKGNFKILIKERAMHTWYQICNLQGIDRNMCACSEHTELGLDFRWVCPNCLLRTRQVWLQTWVETGLQHEELYVFNLFAFICEPPIVWYRWVCFPSPSLNVLQNYIWKFNLAVLTWVEHNSITNQVNGSLAILPMHIKSGILNLWGHARLRYRTTSDSLAWLSAENGLLSLSVFLSTVNSKLFNPSWTKLQWKSLFKFNLNQISLQMWQCMSTLTGSDCDSDDHSITKSGRWPWEISSPTFCSEQDQLQWRSTWMCNRKVAMLAMPWLSSFSATSQSCTLINRGVPPCPAEGIFWSPSLAPSLWYLWLISFFHKHKGVQRHHYRLGKCDNLIREGRVPWPSSSQGCPRGWTWHSEHQSTSLRHPTDWGSIACRNTGLVMGCGSRALWGCTKPSWVFSAGEEVAGKGRDRGSLGGDKRERLQVIRLLVSSLVWPCQALISV